MLWELHRHGKTEQIAAKPDSDVKRQVPVLSLELAHGLLGFDLTFNSFGKGRHGSGDFSVEYSYFAVDFLGRKAQKIRQKIRHPKTKNSPKDNPPKPTSWSKKSAAKSTNKSGRQTSKHTPGFLRLRRFAPGGVFRAWILGHFWLPFGHGRGSRAEMHLQSFSCC